MFINVVGRHPKVPKKLIKEAISFAAPLLMSSRMIKTLDIEVILVSDLWETDECAGYCMGTNDNYSTPRIFEVYLDTRCSRVRMLTNLFHEMVHCKQYATGELKEYVRQPMTRFQDEVYPDEDDDDDEYWERPWEIEAYGREYGLYKRFAEYLKNK